jgi:hypothetical protein
LLAGEHGLQHDLAGILTLFGFLFIGCAHDEKDTGSVRGLPSPGA